MWLHTQVEFELAGKSREDDLKFLLPEVWQLGGMVNNPDPGWRSTRRVI